MTDSTVLSPINDRIPCRMWISLSLKSPHWNDPDSVLNVILESIPARIDATTDIRFLAKQTWPKRCFLIYDLFNAEYDYMRGHFLEMNTLPIIWIQSGKEMTFREAPPKLSEQVNHEVARMHNVNGFVPPPYTEDHCNGAVPVYYNARDPSLLTYKSK